MGYSADSKQKLVLNPVDLLLFFICREYFTSNGISRSQQRKASYKQKIIMACNTTKHINIIVVDLDNARLFVRALMRKEQIAYRIFAKSIQKERAC